MIFLCIFVLLLASAPLFLFLRPSNTAMETSPEPEPLNVPPSFGLEASRNG